MAEKMLWCSELEWLEHVQLFTSTFSHQMLPVIGEAPAHPGLWFAFGHGHAGVGMGAITGRLLSELISGAEPVINVAPFSGLSQVG